MWDSGAEFGNIRQTIKTGTNHSLELDIQSKIRIKGYKKGPRPKQYDDLYKTFFNQPLNQKPIITYI